MTIAENVDRVRERIASACERVGRSQDSVRLMAVTKHRASEEMQEAIDAGVTIIGENRLQEAMDKFDKHDFSNVERHYIGNLQSNKVKAAVERFDCLQSVFKLYIAKEIDKRAYKLGKVVPVYVEINMGDQETKQGLVPEDALDFVNKVNRYTNVKVEGIMTILPYFPPEETRPFCKQMYHLKKRLGVKTLSMGMSNDFEIAIEEGSDMVRIGTAIFGERKKH